MIKKRVYFRRDVLVEPLFNQWYAWSNLIPPHSCAMYIANAHIKIMESFVASPQAHISALKNPAMVGGPFINYDSGKVGDIKQLLDRTRKEQAHMLELAQAINKLDAMLQEEGTGYSLEPLYPRVPDILRGYVELVYDLRHRPSIRFIEGLLYQSKFYDPKSQSIALARRESDDRSFVFSTPRLKGDGWLFLDAPFSHEGLDELFKLRFAPGRYETIKEMLNVGDEQEVVFSSFFTEAEPAKRVKYEGEGVRIRYFGHACVLIETKGVSILSDPVISYGDGQDTDCYTHADLPEVIDYVLITHNHQDHLVFEHLLQLRHQIRNLVVPRSSGTDRMDSSMKLLLQTVGFKNVLELDELESLSLEGGTLTGLPFLGEHSDLNVKGKMAYLVELLGKKIALTADSRNVEPQMYEHLRQCLGKIDILFLGMECEGAPLSWFYGPLFTIPLLRKHDQSRRQNGSDYERGIGMVDALRPEQVYVYAMGQEPWLKYLTSLQYAPESAQIVESDKLVVECQRRGLAAERLYLHKEIFL